MSELTATSDCQLRTIRETRGWTLEDTAGLTGASVGYLSRLERGERRASPELRVKIARRLGLPVSEVFPLSPLTEER